MENDVIRVSDLEVRYDRQPVLRDVSLSVGAGEIIGLLGPSGSGKTTLVRSIIGMKEPVRGTVEVRGVRMPSLSAVLKIGYMAQSDALYEDLSGLDNLKFFAELYGLDRPARARRAREALDLVGLGSDGRKLVKNYSGGMKRRLSLAIALVHDPSLLILDEPTIGIDPLLRVSFWTEFRRIREAGGTILLTTHAMDEAAKCDRLAMIREGRIIADGPVNELIARAGAKDLEEAFLFYSTRGEASS
jgi:ABC-2 type transport system ATP-binding protein